MDRWKSPRPRKQLLAPGRVPIRFRLLLGFTVPLAIWILVSGVNITVWNRAFENSERLFNSQSAIVLANEYISASLRVQSAKRGFLISSDPDFLALFRDAANTVTGVHRQLSERTRDDPDQFARLQEAGDRFQQWLYDVSWPHIETRRRLPVDAVQDAHDLEKAMLVLQSRHMRATHREMDELLRNIHDNIHRLMQREQLRDRQPELQQALDQFDRYRRASEKNAAHEADHADNALRAFIATLTRVIKSILDADEEIRLSVTDDKHHSLLDEFHSRMNRFIAVETARLTGYRKEMAKANERGRLVLWTGPALGLLLMVIMTSWMSRRIAQSLDNISKAARGLARGELDARAAVRGTDEFAVLAERFNTMADLVETRSHESAALAELGELLQSSASIDEAAGIFAGLVTRLFPGQPGALYLMAPSRDELVAVAVWFTGNEYSVAEFAPGDCWALRLGRVHENHNGDAVRCAHLTERQCTSLCLPLQAFGEMLGILFVANADDSFPPGSVGAEQHREFMETVGEHLALALANLRLRETLRHQSIRDPLTQLYNRRYLDESFRRELHRASRRGLPLCVLTFDIDHFKNFNDTHGHDGGDVLLQAVGNSLHDFFRAEDGAFRSGGEEFVAILPETTLDDALSRAEELRREIASLEVHSGNLVLPAVTISVGVAAFPEHGRTAEQLLKAADNALYRAKEGGRNRVVAAE